MPMKFHPMPSRERVREAFQYDPETGNLIRLECKTKLMKRYVGKVAGFRSKASIRVGLDGFQWAAHRLIWVYAHGSIPDGMEIDHIDGDFYNNKLSNLRLATSAQQKQNKRTQSNNRSGLKGAYYHACRKGKKWRTQIKRPDGVLQFIGYFHTAEEAHEAYMSASREICGEFHREV